MMVTMIYRYYTLYRPPIPGGIPKGALNTFSYDYKEIVSEIGRLAWGYADYDHELSTEEVREYELSECVLLSFH